MDAKQLVHLRRRIDRINRKYVSGPPRRIAALADKIEGLIDGEIVHTLRGAHFETERLWGPHHRHGCVNISELAALPNDLFRWLSNGENAHADSCRWAFLDTETIGLAEGAGGAQGSVAFFFRLSRTNRTNVRSSAIGLSPASISAPTYRKMSIPREKDGVRPNSSAELVPVTLQLMYAGQAPEHDQPFDLGQIRGVAGIVSSAGIFIKKLSTIEFQQRDLYKALKETRKLVYYGKRFLDLAKQISS